MKKQATATVTYPKTLLLGIQTPENYMVNVESYFEEFRNLARTNGVKDPEELYIKIRTIDPGYFLTKGKRDEIDVPEQLPFYSFDTWNAYEISWLNPQGKPEIALGEFSFPSTSPNIVESKSFKLYLNSLIQTHFASIEEE